MLRVDCHFHPNFPFFLPEFFVRRHAEKLWRAFGQRKLDVVFVAEHAYKQPLRSYRTLLKYRPRNARTHIVPAVETVSREGIDMIVFAEDEHVYRQRDILTPFRLPIARLVERVHRDPRLFGVIPHPYAPSETGFLRYRSASDLLNEENILHFAEKFNGALLSTKHILLFLHLTRLFKKCIKRVNCTLSMPVRMTPRGLILLGGSDAHHVWDIGSYLCIHAPRPSNYHSTFAAVTRESHKRTFYWRRQKAFPILTVLLEGATTAHERLMKIFGLYRVETLVPSPMSARLSKS